MKTSNVLASLFFGALAVAKPIDKRALATATVVVIETVYQTTTVWVDEAPAATSAPGLFYEKPASSKAEPTTTHEAPAYTPPVYNEPSSSSVYVAPPPPSSSSVYTPPPAPSSVYTPPASSQVYTPPPAPVSSAAPAQSSTAAGNGDGTKYHGDITIYDNTGAAGACGLALTDDMAICALSKATWGESTYDYMTGEATNPWCGKTITLSYNGRTAECVIQDMCPGCSGADMDLSYSVWQKLTGTTEKTRYQADWWVSS